MFSQAPQPLFFHKKKLHIAHTEPTRSFVFIHLPRLSMPSLISFTSHISVRMAGLAANRRNPEFPLRPQEIPPRLYHVHYLSSMTTLDDSGFRAQDGSPNTVDLSSIVKYLDRSNTDPSPWISLFDNEEHAMNWAQGQRRARRAMGLWDERYYVSEIDGTKLGIVFSVARLLNRGWVERGSLDEFLVWKFIPFTAMRGCIILD
jgi:hypothetical protein